MSQTDTDLTVTEILRQQHQRIRLLFDEVHAAKGDARTEVFDCLRALLAVHETAEEEVVHPTVRLMGDVGERAVRARLAEEDQAKKTLSELERTGPGGEGFDLRFLEFQTAVIDHAEAEEREVFPLLDASEDHETLRAMGTALLAAEKMAPTHPHPHAPETALPNLLVGPAVAIIDRVRDAIKEAR